MKYPDLFHWTHRMLLRNERFSMSFSMNCFWLKEISCENEKLSGMYIETETLNITLGIRYISKKIEFC